MRKIIAGSALACVLLGPAAVLLTVALVVNPAASAATTCTITTDTNTDTDAGANTDAGADTGGAAKSAAPRLSVDATVPASLVAANANGQAITLGHTQLQRAVAIIAVGASEHIPTRGQLVAVTAALTESSLRVLSNTGAYPASATYPHDGNGGDHDSLGLFQMRPSTGWGSVADLMDPAWSARAFYGGPAGPNHGSPQGLLDIAGWQAMSPGAAAQAVEVSKYPDRYALNQPVAEKVLSALTGVDLTTLDTTACTNTDGGPGDAGDGGVPANLPAGFAGRLIAAAAKQIDKPYVWGGGTYTGPSGIGRDGRGPGFDCSGLVLYAAYQASDGKIRLPHYTGDQIHDGRPVSWAAKQPGDLIFFSYHGPGVPHHVAIYLGGNRILQAPRTGENVRYGTISEFAGQVMTVRRLD